VKSVPDELISLDRLFDEFPDGIRAELLNAFQNIGQNFREGRWEPSELNGGKLCEVVYSILKGHVEGKIPSSASKPQNMYLACTELEKAGSHFPRSIKIQIPRVLIVLYEIRNNRGVGHVGGDIDPNYMDAVCVLQMAKWVVSELVRIFHGVSSDDAAAAIEAVSDREISVIWKINGVSRVLDTSLKMIDKALLLLYGAPAGLSEAKLFEYLEHSNITVYRKILKKAHAQRLLEYNQDTGLVIISPTGSDLIESKIKLMKRKGDK